MGAAIRALLLDDTTAGASWQALERMLSDETAAAWRRKVVQWQRQVGTLPQPVILQQEVNPAVETEVEALREQMAKAARLTARAGGGTGAAVANQSQQRAATTESAPARSARPPAVGQLPCTQEDAPAKQTEARAAQRIDVWQPKAAGAVVPAHSLIPRRARPYKPKAGEQMSQWQRVRSWNTQRLVKAGGANVFFSIGAMEEAIRAWRTKTGAETERSPPVSILRPRADSAALPTMLASNSGFIWSVLDQAPLDAEQLAAATGAPELGVHLQRLVDEGLLTETELRAAVGGATYGGCLQVVAARCSQRLPARWLEGLPDGLTVGAVGAGLGITALQVAKYWNGRVAFAIDACPKVGPAGFRLLELAGQEAEAIALRAEEASLRTRRLRTAIEVITLRCSPFCPRSGKDLEAALLELWRVIQGVAARAPRVIVYENTAGLWEVDDTRARVEALLQTLQAYNWEAMVVDPVAHAQAGVHRKRVFYTGIRKERRVASAGVKAEGPAGSTGAAAETQGAAPPPLTAKQIREMLIEDAAAEAKRRTELEEMRPKRKTQQPDWFGPRGEAARGREARGGRSVPERFMILDSELPPTLTRRGSEKRTDWADKYTRIGNAAMDGERERARREARAREKDAMGRSRGTVEGAADRRRSDSEPSAAGQEGSSARSRSPRDRGQESQQPASPTADTTAVDTTEESDEKEEEGSREGGGPSGTQEEARATAPPPLRRALTLGSKDGYLIVTAPKGSYVGEKLLVMDTQGNIARITVPPGWRVGQKMGCRPQAPLQSTACEPERKGCVICWGEGERLRCFSETHCSEKCATRREGSGICPPCAAQAVRKGTTHCPCCRLGPALAWGSSGALLPAPGTTRSGAQR